jgi:hypothetical protein
LLDRKANADATVKTTASATAGFFDKLRTGSAAALFARCANDFAQDDNFGVMSTATANAKTEADPYGITTRKVKSNH